MAVVVDVILHRAREAVRVLSREARVRGAYLFGSHVSGKEHRWSDIDIAAFVEGLEEWDIERRAEVAALVQEEAGDDVELHFFPAEYLDNPPAASFAAFVLRHGIPVPKEN